ncbi:MAG: amidohydrolase family protein [Alphaproteobacteria bacterium]|nr:amidohydrolase family protein [Alphaproteobacteria bacterium]
MSSPVTSPPNTKVVCIRNAAWVAAWEPESDRHVYRRDIDVAFSGDGIRHVGKDYGGPVDEVVDGRAVFVIPGLIDVHSHPHIEPSYKGLREEHGVPEMFMTGLYERGQAFNLDEEGRKAGAEVAYSELLACGVTSLADLSSPFDGWVELMAKSGLRGFVGPGYASARWYMSNRHQLQFDWNEQSGKQAMAHAISIMEAAEQHECGRLSGVIYPAQIDTCTEDLLRDSADLARDTGRPVTTHAAQSVLEFNVMVDRHGKTPIQFARDIGFLGPNTLLGHAIFIDEHSWLHWWSKQDLSALVDSGTSVAHCPTPFCRYGQTLQDLGRYLRAGVNIGLGTDVSPHNLIEEMRTAAIMARVTAEDIDTVHTADVFHAATIGGANALLRDDLGRLGPGKKADLAVIDLADVTMMPARDPLRSLVYTAAERAVRDVYVDGVKVVSDRQVLTLDRRDAAGRLAEAQARMIDAVPNNDYAGRTADEITPLSLLLK